MRPGIQVLNRWLFWHLKARKLPYFAVYKTRDGAKKFKVGRGAKVDSFIRLKNQLLKKHSNASQYFNI